MSTSHPHERFRHIAILLGVAAFVVCARGTGYGQNVNVLLKLSPENSRVMVEGSCPPNSHWSFRDSYAGVLGLGNRVDRFVVLDENDGEIPTRKIAPGQFDSAKPASRFRYEVNLTPPLSGSDSSRVSWLNDQRGLLMLADLLPIFSSNVNGANVTFQTPASWAVFSDEKQGSQALVTEIDRAVFAVGGKLRSSQITESGMTFRLVLDGEWAFADGEVQEMAGKILKAHREVFEVTPGRQGTLILFHFPRPAPANQWSAETRGATVTLLLGKLPSKVGALAQLSTPLTHELFHLWVPNALALEGDYDWFYEGFTVYQAARTAVRLDLLTFPELLNAIARANDAAGPSTNALSLIEASGKRWTTGQPFVYSKSMVVAFLYDLRMRSASRGKRSLDNVYRDVIEKHSQRTASADGNDAAIMALAVDAAAEDFVRKFIRNPVTIDLATELAPFGLQVETFGLRTRISVNEKLNKKQRDLLRQLGYNDAVRAPRH